MRSFCGVVLATLFAGLVLLSLVPSITFASSASRISSTAISGARALPAQKIVSINLCFDGLLLKLVERSRIDSLYYLSANPQFSPFAAQTHGLFLNRGLAEDIVPRNPDLILAGEFSSSDLVALLTQLKFRVEVLPLPRSIAEIIEQIRYFGKLVSREVAANAMARNIEQEIALLDSIPQAQHKITAFWYASNGVVVGGDTLENELMQHAGLHNLALDKHIIGFAQIDLEDLILARPQVIIVESSDVAAFSLAREYIKHPALRKNNTRILALPSSLSVCAAPVLADAIREMRMQVSRL